MSFNEGAGLDTSQVTGGGGGGGSRGPVLMGGGAGSIVLLFLGLIFGGGALGGGGSSSSGYDPGQLTQSGSQEQEASFDQCKTGADANRYDTCRIVGTVNSVQDYWTDALPTDANRQYRQAKTVIYQGSTQSSCGTASSATGPFYCPTDERVYIDAAFFSELSSKYGADDGALAQEYVVAHEYGHHLQNILGVLGAAQRDREGPASGSVRIELMADCLAGVWANHAATTKDAQGTTLIKPLTESDIRSALSAASAVGDDRLQEQATGSVNPESWTHGSSEQRQRWFIAGYQGGNLNRCDTLSVSAGRL